MPLGDERWEIRVEDSSEDELDVVLHTIARWANENDVAETQVLVDGQQVDLPRA